MSSGRLRGLEEELEDFETNGQDLSALSGSPIFMRKISGKRNAPARTESIDSEQALAQAEYERLESGWKPGVLGRGMMTVVESPFVYESAPVRSATYRRGLPTVDREEIRKVAEEKGEIVAVSGKQDRSLCWSKDCRISIFFEVRRDHGRRMANIQ